MLSSRPRTFPRLGGVEIPEFYQVHGFTGLDRDYAYNRLLRGSVHPLPKPHDLGSGVELPTCTHNRKKLRLKSVPERTYLFVTVIKMLEPQYDRIGGMGLVLMGAPGAGVVGILCIGGCGESPRFSLMPMSTA